jgi:hypothetical protein
MRSQLHVDDTGAWPPSPRVAEGQRLDLSQFKIRPPWLVFLARHLAPRNHARYLLQGSDIPQEEWDRAFPPLTPEEKARLEEVGVHFGTGEPMPVFTPVKPRPRWLAFLYRHHLLRDEDDE